MNKVYNYTLYPGDVVLIQEHGWGFGDYDRGKYVEIVEYDPDGYCGNGGVRVKEYDTPLESVSTYAGVESFGEVPMILLNTKEERGASAKCEVSTITEEEYTGSSSNYYKVFVKNPTTLEHPYEAECNDIIEALKMTFAEGNAFKAIWRKAKARQGVKKKGYDNGVYDSEKVVFFGERMLVEAKENEPI